MHYIISVLPTCAISRVGLIVAEPYVGVYFLCGQKNDKVRHNNTMTQIASLLAVATVFIGLCLFYSLITVNSVILPPIYTHLKYEVSGIITSYRKSGNFRCKNIFVGYEN